MADRGGARGGGFGDRGRGDRGRGRGRGRGRRGGKSEEKEWQPVTKLGRLVKAGKIKSMEEIYLHYLPIKEYQIVDFFLPKLKDEVMKIKPVQKQTRAGQRTRFKAIVIIGDSEGHVGLGIKTSKEVATAIRAAIIIAKLSVIPVRRGYWGTNLGLPHSLPVKESGKCGSVTVRVCQKSRMVDGWMDVHWFHAPANATCFYLAYPCPPWYPDRRFARRQAASTARRYRGRLHVLVRFDQDSREHPEGHLRRHLQHLRLPDAQPVEGDAAHPEPAGRVRRHPAGG